MAPSMVPAAVSPGWRTSTSWRSSCSSSRLASSVTSSRELRVTSSGWSSKLAQGVGQVPDHVVEPDAGQADLRLALHALVGHQDDGRTGLDHPAGVLGVAAAETDVDGADEVAHGELVGVARVEHHGSAPLPAQDLGEREHGWRAGLVEDLVHLAVAAGVEREVGGRRGLPVGHGGDECLLRHVLHRVVRGPLLADGGRRLRREALAARRPCAVPREEARAVRERQQLPVDRVVQRATEPPRW